MTFRGKELANPSIQISPIKHFLVCFHQEVEQASRAMEELQGSMLESSDRGGLHIEYYHSPVLYYRLCSTPTSSDYTFPAFIF